jgi:HPt (histidine-containing phosphotransfer) domain-containing protein
MNDLPDPRDGAFDTQARALAAMFLAAREADLARLDSAIPASDFASVGSIGHVFRGSGATFGFPEASRLGAQLEAAASRRDADEAREIAAALRACLARGSPAR